MPKQRDEGPTESTVRFRKRIGMILCFGAGLYLLTLSLGMLRHAGALADDARRYAVAPRCSGVTSTVNCRELVRASVEGTVTVDRETFYRLHPQGHQPVDFHVPGNRALFQDLLTRRPVILEYFRGQVTSMRDERGNVENAFGDPESSSRNTAEGSSGVLFFALTLLAVGLAVRRIPVDLVAAGGPGRYTLPYSIRPPQRWLYGVFAAPALAWIGPAIIDAKAQPSPSFTHLVNEFAGGVVFAVFIAAVFVLFAAWYLENRIDLTPEGIRYRTLFTRRSVRFDEIAAWQVRYRRRSSKIQYVDIYQRGKKTPIRLQMDMHWRRSKEIVYDILRRRVPTPEEGGARSASG